MPLIEGQLDVFTDDLGTIEAGNAYSRQEKYALVNTVGDDNPAPVC